MTFWAVVGVIEICVLSALLDNDWAAAVVHVDWDAVAKVRATKSNNAFRMACFMLFLSRALDYAHLLDLFGVPLARDFDLRGRLVVLPGDGPVFIRPSRLDDQVSISGELVNAREVLADEEIPRYRSLHVMRQSMRRFIHVVAPEGRLVPILGVLVRLSNCRLGVHKLHGHMAVARIDRHAFRLRDRAGLAIRPWRIYAHQMPRSDQLFPCRVMACYLLLCRLSLGETGNSYNCS